jgi:hypothetical protein
MLHASPSSRPTLRALLSRPVRRLKSRLLLHLLSRDRLFQLVFGLNGFTPLLGQMLRARIETFLLQQGERKLYESARGEMW